MRIQASVVLIFTVAGLAGCVGEGDSPPSASLAPVSTNAAAPAIDASQPVPASVLSESQPRQATYRCGGNATLTVENMRSSVLLVDPQGESVMLPASPVSQQTRYGQPGYALVLEGRDALYMKGGKPPLTCRR